MEGQEGCVVEIDAEQITLPAVEDSRRRPTSRAFILEHTHMLTQRGGGGGLQSVFVCGHLCGQ